ncbi:MAG: hypothetical protein M1469_00455 [Bacteroidetes bacterium]|nr:hypothetical protein [Bacteroidota bacterium]
MKIGEDVGNPEESVIVWSDYLKYRAELRGFELSKIENILRHSGERYFDTAARRLIVVGKHDDRLVLIPYEKQGNEITPVTIHATTRQQINFRLKTGRFIL